VSKLGTVIVTGGSRGIGAAICRLLASRGYAVAVNYTTKPEAAERVAAAIREDGGRAAPIGADVADPRQVYTLFETAARSLGPIVGLVNNAGTTGVTARMDMQEPDDLHRLFAVNVFGTMYCAREAVRRMSTGHGGGGGAIVNVSSAAARLGGLSGLAPYAASKGAVESFTRGLANEVALEGIRVNAVAPGMTATEMATEEMRAAVKNGGIPMARIGEAEEIAEAVVWLLSPAASYVTGVVLTVSGGR
jgi:NAD(P)-dependent dehydrogenase (short-subunit alcohol dehydrogenase family)